MLNLLSSVVDILVTIVNFITSTISSMLNFLINVPQYISFTISSLNILPSFVIPFALASVSLMVLWLVREVI